VKIGSLGKNRKSLAYREVSFVTELPLCISPKRGNAFRTSQIDALLGKDNTWIIQSGLVDFRLFVNKGISLISIKTTAYTALNHDAFPQKFSEITSAIISRPDIFGNLPVEPAMLEAAAKAMRELTGLASNGWRQKKPE